MIELGVSSGKLDAANTRVGGGCGGLQAEHTYMDARTYARTHIRGGSDRQREKERECRPIGEPFESLGGLLCDAAVQLGWCHGVV
jgi:hypothetical protein